MGCRSMPALHARVLREGKVMGMAASTEGFSLWPRPVRHLHQTLQHDFV